MAITAAQVKALRERTGAGMMDCKAALESAGGDVEGAIRYLREKGLATAAKRAGRAAAEGAIVARLVSPAEGVMLELNCETDFVAKTPHFVELAERIAGVLAGWDALQGEAAAEDLGIGERKLADGKTVADAIADSVAAMGENVLVRRVARLAAEPGRGRVGCYVHGGGKIGVLVEAATTAGEGEAGAELDRLLKDVAMQVAAASPRFVRREDVPAAELEREREIFRNQAAASGKPEKVLDRIVEGKLEKFYAEACLVEQEFIRDSQQTVGRLVDAVGKRLGAPIEIRRFVRLQLGESAGGA